jgi:hypothetical protein
MQQAQKKHSIFFLLYQNRKIITDYYSLYEFILLNGHGVTFDPILSNNELDENIKCILVSYIIFCYSNDSNMFDLKMPSHDNKEKILHVIQSLGHSKTNIDNAKITIIPSNHFSYYTAKENYLRSQEDLEFTLAIGWNNYITNASADTSIIGLDEKEKRFKTANLTSLDALMTKHSLLSKKIKEKFNNLDNLLKEENKDSNDRIETFEERLSRKLKPNS